MTYQKSFNQWTLPQGGVDNKKTIKETFFLEMGEEVTEDFVKTCNREIELIAVDKIEFPPSKQGLRDLVTDSGESVVMKGKYYYFYVAEAKDTNITIGATEFDDVKWLNYDEAYKLIKETNTGGRLRMITNLLRLLSEKGLLSTNQPTNHGSDEQRPVKPRLNVNSGGLSKRGGRDDRRRYGSQLHSAPGMGIGSDRGSGRNTP
ncbi:MAG: hypothetical protein ACD_61C00207G0001, partial [uncultured bacterium]